MAKPPKKAPPKGPKALRVYPPRQVPDFEARVVAAAEAESQRQQRTVSVSEWFVRLAIAQLDSDPK